MENLSTAFDKPQKTICVDFDDVITDNQSAWISFISAFKSVGYRVIVCTYRNPNTSPEDLNFLKELNIPVFFTNYVAKKEYLKNNGITVDIWIDDTPETILLNNF